jgi:hypothetical protein
VAGRRRNACGGVDELAHACRIAFFTYSTTIFTKKVAGHYFSPRSASCGPKCWSWNGDNAPALEITFHRRRLAQSPCLSSNLSIWFYPTAQAARKASEKNVGLSELLAQALARPHCADASGHKPIGHPGVLVTRISTPQRSSGTNTPTQSDMRGSHYPNIQIQALVFVHAHNIARNRRGNQSYSRAPSGVLNTPSQLCETADDVSSSGYPSNLHPFLDAPQRAQRFLYSASALSICIIVSLRL